MAYADNADRLFLRFYGKKEIRNAWQGFRACAGDRIMRDAPVGDGHIVGADFTVSITFGPYDQISLLFLENNKTRRGDSALNILNRRRADFTQDGCPQESQGAHGFRGKVGDSFYQLFEGRKRHEVLAHLFDDIDALQTQLQRGVLSSNPLFTAKPFFISYYDCSQSLMAA